MTRNFIIVLLLASSLLSEAETNDAKTLTLREACEMALHHHPQISAANFRALAALQGVKETRSAFFPQANLVATAAAADSANTRIEAGALNNPSIFDRGAEGLVINQLITDFGRTANLTASSKSQARAEAQNAEATQEKILLLAQVNYFSALQARSMVKVAHQTFATRELLFRQVTALASNQLRSDLDVSFARVSFGESRLLLQKSESDAQAADAMLASALGLRDAEHFELIEQSPPENISTNINDLVWNALGHRPELQSLRHQREAAWRMAKAQRDARLPSINAVGTVGNSFAHDSRLPDSYGAAGVTVSIPLFAGGLYTARQDAAELRARAAEETLRAEEDEVTRDVRIAWLNLNNAVQRLDITEQLLQNANESWRLADAKYRAGASSMIELSQAQLNLTSAEISRTNARYDALIQRANLNYQTGKLDLPGS